MSGDVPEEMKQVIESIKLDKQKRRRMTKLRNVFRTAKKKSAGELQRSPTDVVPMAEVQTQDEALQEKV